MISLLVSQGADITHRDKQGYHLLHHAAMRDQLETLFFLLHEFKLDVDLKDAEGHTPLMWAAYSGFGAVVNLLVAQGASLNCTDAAGNTALHWAAVKGRMQCVETLIARGGDVSLMEENGRTPYEEARRKNHHVVASYIQAASKDLGLAKEGRKRYSNELFFTPFLLLPYFLLIFTYSPYFILSVLVAVGSWGVYWRNLGIYRWIRNEHGRNPFWLGVLVSSYTLSLAIYLMEISVDVALLENFFFLSLNFGWFIAFLKLLYTDPGILPKHTSTIEDILVGLKSRDTISNYCVTCMLRRPVRAKHCRTCSQCVARFDHYCPWINNDVGFGNHRLFLLVIIGLTLIHIWFLYYCTQFLMVSLTEDVGYVYSVFVLFEREPAVLLVMVYHVLFGCFQAFNVVMSVVFILGNVTTNETKNRMKPGYFYLWRNERFESIFSGSFWQNWTEFFFKKRNYFNLFEEDIPGYLHYNSS
uniref:Palmitoyltransferase n=1 Tax=Arcella intermedia TaxID=1963864 RepID=A0A6B2L3C4_9EUKA